MLSVWGDLISFWSVLVFSPSSPFCFYYLIIIVVVVVIIIIGYHCYYFQVACVAGGVV